MPRLGWSTGCFRATSHPYALGQLPVPTTGSQRAADRRCCKFVDCHHRTATLDKPFTHSQRWLAPGTGVTDFIHCEQISIS